MSSPRVWLITGSSTGFGRCLGELILEKGEILVATSRNVDALQVLKEKYPADRLLVLKLNVDHKQEIVDAFAQVKATFGRLDVVVNNAAWAAFGEVESMDETIARATFDTNFWGACNVTTQALKFFREVNAPGVGGRLLQVSSIVGLMSSVGISYYSAAKFAMEGFTESLVTELDPAWNIKITLIEPSGFATAAKGKVQWAPPHPAYAANKDLPITRFRNGWDSYVVAGDPRKAVEVFYKVTTIPDPPVHLIVGESGVKLARKKIAELTADVDKYESWSKFD